MKIFLKILIFVSFLPLFLFLILSIGDFFFGIRPLGDIIGGWAFLIAPFLTPISLCISSFFSVILVIVFLFYRKRN